MEVNEKNFKIYKSIIFRLNKEQQLEKNSEKRKSINLELKDNIEKALEILPNDINLRTNLMYAYIRLNDLNKARAVGEIVGSLGAGRQTKEDVIDKEAGIVFYKKVADKVEKGEKIAQISTNKKEMIEIAQKQLLEAIEIGEEEPKKFPTVLDIIE